MEQFLSKVVERDEYLTLLLFAHRSAIDGTSGQTPTRTVFGREFRLPCDLVFGSAEKFEEEVTDYVEKLLQAHEVVRHRINVASNRTKVH